METKTFKRGDYIFIRTKYGLQSALVVGTSRSGLSVLADTGMGEEKFYEASKCQLQSEWKLENA